MIEFDEHFFQMGCFNHQVVPNYVGIILNHEIWILVQLIKQPDQPVFHNEVRLFFLWLNWEGPSLRHSLMIWIPKD